MSCFSYSCRKNSLNTCKELHRSLQLICNLAIPSRMGKSTQNNNIFL